VKVIFPNVTLHPEYLSGQSKAWCSELASQTGKYEYTWNYEVEGTAAEDIFADKLAGLIRGKVLDVGCGHGEFTNRWSAMADEIVGYDMTEGFLATARRHHLSPNVRYVLGFTRDGLPFADHEFDVAYTKKGPGSWYPEAKRILKANADVLSLHPGDGNGVGGELGLMFPGLFAPPEKGTPVWDKIGAYLAQSGLQIIERRVLREIVYIPSAEDILTLVCFGQNERFRGYVREACFRDIERQFDRHREDRGIRTTGFYYLIHAKAPCA
jgi:SAM-dependent methyltransferase